MIDALAQLELSLAGLMVQGTCMVEDLKQSKGSHRKLRKAIYRLSVDAEHTMERLKVLRRQRGIYPHD